MLTQFDNFTAGQLASICVLRMRVNIYFYLYIWNMVMGHKYCMRSMISAGN